MQNQMPKTVLDGSTSLLVEVAGILNENKIEYIVVGGWSPYLRCSKAIIAHPGTKDVDILFSDKTVDDKGLRDIIELFLSRDFFVSAKHDFQLLKKVSVNGRELGFNVDLLHPSETKDNPQLFADHFDLNISESDLGSPKFVKSVVLPTSRILFEDEFYNNMDVVDPITGTSVKIPIITECGCILSKSESVKSRKRERDAFDIYLSLKNIKTNYFVETLKKYLNASDIKQTLTSLNTHLGNSENAKLFNNAVKKYAGETQLLDDPAAFVKKALDELLES